MVRAPIVAADIYTIQAQRRGYPCRSVFKLEQIDRDHRLIRRGFQVADFGSAPGSWFRYLSGVVGRRGAVLGIDRQPLGPSVKVPSNAHFLLQDLMTWNPDQRLYSRFDVVVSDMAPNSSGIRTHDWAVCHDLNLTTLSIADVLLKPDGALLMKTFRGDQFEALRKSVVDRFLDVKFVKPNASRPESAEIFVLARLRRP